MRLLFYGMVWLLMALHGTCWNMFQNAQLTQHTHYHVCSMRILLYAVCRTIPFDLMLLNVDCVYIRGKSDRAPRVFQIRIYMVITRIITIHWIVISSKFRMNSYRLRVTRTQSLTFLKTILYFMGKLFFPFNLCAHVRSFRHSVCSFYFHFMMVSDEKRIKSYLFGLCTWLSRKTNLKEIDISKQIQI